MKKRILCTLLTVTLCIAQLLPVSAETVSQNDAEVTEADARTEDPAPAEDAAVQTEEELTPEAAGESFILKVPARIEEGVEYNMGIMVTPATLYTIRIVDKKTGAVPLSSQKTAPAGTGDSNIVETKFTIGKDDLPAGDYEVQSWVGHGDYEAAKSAGILQTANMSVCRSILKEHNKYMSDIKVESALYVGKNKEVFPAVTIVETRDGKEYTLVKDKDFKITVISDNKAQMGAAKAKIEGIGTYAGSKEVDFDIAPKKPAFTSIVCNSVSSVKMTWEKSENATGYYIDRKANAAAYQNVAKVSDSEPASYTDVADAGLSVGETYTYRIRAYAASEVDPTKEVVSSESEISVKIIPETPKLESVVSTSTKKQKVTWKKTDDADGYVVYKIVKKRETKVKEVRSGDQTSCSIGKLTTGSSYTYCVRAYKKNAQGTKIYSEPSKSVKKKVTVGTPKLVSVKSVTATENVIKWKKTSEAYGYYIYRRNASTAGAKYKKIGTVTNGTVTSYHDTTAATGKIYVYTVKAYTKAKVNGVKKKLVGDYDSKGISGKAVPAKTVFSVQQNERGVLITIANSEGATGYYLYRKKGSDKWTKRDVPAQGGDLTVYLDKDITAKTSYQYYIVPYTKTGTQIITGEPADTMKFQTK